jgi:mycothiol synthase
VSDAWDAFNLVLTLFKLTDFKYTGISVQLSRGLAKEIGDMGEIGGILEIRPGRVAALLADRLAAIETESAAGAVWTALEAARRGGVRFVQTLVDPADERGAKLLQACGFSPVTEVLYLVCSLAGREAAQSCEDLRLVSVGNSPATLRRLSALIPQTYAGSQDCPRLNGLRPIDEVLASYRAVGESDLRRWFIAEQENADAGCILLAEHSTPRELEIVYMGIVPQFRGRGLGMKLVRHAQRVASDLNIARLSLAVDAENRFALAVYCAAGYQVAAKHRLFLRQLEI